VRHVTVSYAGKPVMDADVDFSISDNPSFRFFFMPEKEGMETIRSLRDRFAFMPILVVSGGIAGQRSDFLGMSVRLGASAAISKPFLPSELVLAVRNLAKEAGLAHGA
jgi:DNA-binding NarL/FixJ family response regulator